MSKASLQQMGAWLIELALIEHRERTPYSFYGDGAKPDPLFQTATRWGLDVEAIKAASASSRNPTARSRSDVKTRRVSERVRTARHARSALNCPIYHAMCDDLPSVHSCLSAVMGSIFDARRAGM